MRNIILPIEHGTTRDHPRQRSIMTRISRHEFCRNGTLDGYTIATELPLHGNLYPPTRIPPSCTKNYEISTMLDHRVLSCY